MDKNKEPPKTKIEPCTRDLLCILTPDEINAANMRASFKDNEYDEESLKYDEIKKLWKKKLDDITAERKRLQRSAREGKEFRNVDCEIRYVFSASPPRVETVRLDTGELIDTRAMSAAELQTLLPFQEPDVDDEFGEDPGEDDKKPEDEDKDGPDGPES